MYVPSLSWERLESVFLTECILGHIINRSTQELSTQAGHQRTLYTPDNGQSMTFFEFYGFLGISPDFNAQNLKMKKAWKYIERHEPAGYIENLQQPTHKEPTFAIILGLLAGQEMMEIYPLQVLGSREPRNIKKEQCISGKEPTARRLYTLQEEEYSHYCLVINGPN